MKLPDFAALFDATPNPYMVLDSTLTYVAANRAYFAATGSTPDDLIGKHVFARFPHDPDNAENANVRTLRASFEKVLRTGQPDHIAVIRYRVERERGAPPEDRDWSATHTPILDESGKVAFILQHTTDVTEVNRLRSAAGDGGILQRARAVQDEVGHLRRLFDQAPGFVAILREPNHVFELTNRAYLELVGHRNVVGLPVVEALPEVVGQGFIELLDGVCASGKPFIGNNVAIALQNSPNGPLEARYLDFIYQPFFDAEGKAVGIFVQGNDVTDRKRLEDDRESARAEAERANRLKDEFLATVSHELRTPLTAMLGWLQLLNSGQVKEDRRASVLETVYRNTRALAQIVDDILDLSRVITGKMGLSVEPMRVGEAMEAAIESLRPTAEAKGIRLDATLDSEAHVLGDPARLQQVFWNLLTNATKFTPKGGRVHIVVRRVDSSVEIIVRDNGRGIPSEFLPFVFERFRQADGKSTRKHGGLGLGLAIVKSLVELHGGTVTAESEGEDRGSTFIVVLPVSLAQSIPDVSTPDSRAALGCPPELGGLRILVVDDEADTRDLIREILTNCGVLVRTAASVKEAMVLFAEAPPDILLSDVGMPGEDGYSFIRRIRALPADEGGRVPAVALTAYARAEERTQLLRAGFKAHVTKPVEIPELLAVLAALAG